MKLLSILVTALIAFPLAASADSEPPEVQTTHRVVFEVTMAGSEQWTALLNNVENLRAAFGDATQIEIVAHGQGLGLLVAKENALAERMKKLSARGIVFTACENTMKRQGIGKDQLLPFATTTDSGVAEVVRKEEAGWSYIKSGT